MTSTGWGESFRVRAVSKMREEVLSRLDACRQRTTICPCHCHSEELRLQQDSYRSPTIQDLSTYQEYCVKLDRLIHQEHINQDAYPHWTREELRTRLKQRRIGVHKKLKKKALVATLRWADQTCCFRLMDLPQELRLRIYEFSLAEAVVSSTKAPKTPALLQTCHQIRGEAKDVFFRTSRFVLHVPSYPIAWFSDDVNQKSFEEHTYSWLSRIGCRNEQNLRYLRFHFSGLGEGFLEVDIHPQSPTIRFTHTLVDHIPTCTAQHWLSPAQPAATPIFGGNGTNADASKAEEAICRFRRLCISNSDGPPNTSIEGLEILAEAAKAILRARFVGRSSLIDDILEL